MSNMCIPNNSTILFNEKVIYEQPYYNKNSIDSIIDNNNNKGDDNHNKLNKNSFKMLAKYLIQIAQEAQEVCISKQEHIDRLDAKIDTLKKEINILKNELNEREMSVHKDDCCVCMIKQKNYAFSGCGHLCVCENCAYKCQLKCPICIKVSNIIKIFR